MNRVVLHNCPAHTMEDLRSTAEEIIKASTDNDGIQSTLTQKLQLIADLYTTLLKEQKVQDFFGARDFYACIQLLTVKYKGK